MAKTYTATLDLSIGGNTPTWEGEATVSYIVVWGAPATGPTYDCGGTPADPDDVNDIRVTHIDGVPISKREHGKHEADTLETHLECSDRLVGELLEIAFVEDADDHADVMDRRDEDRRERLREPF